MQKPVRTDVVSPLPLIDGVEIGTLVELAQWTLAADKVLDILNSRGKSSRVRIDFQQENQANMRRPSRLFFLCHLSSSPLS